MKISTTAWPLLMKATYEACLRNKAAKGHAVQSQEAKDIAARSAALCSTAQQAI